MRHLLATAGLCLALAGPVLAQEHGGPLLGNDDRSASTMNVAGRLACDCGCPHEPLDVCRCGTAQKYRLEIGALLKSGKTEEEALAAMLEKYGNSLLAEPPDTPMGILAKAILPVTLALVGLLIAAVVISRLRAKAALAPVAAGDAGDGVDPRYLNMVDDEVEKG